MITPSLAQAEDFYLGEVFQTATNFCPRGTVEARGQLLPIVENQPLWSLYGAQFGGNGRTSFGMPDLTGSDENPPAFEPEGLRWCARISGKYPSRNSEPPANASNSGLIIRTGATYCDENWHKTTSDVQPKTAYALQLTNCVAGMNAETDFEWYLGQIVTADEPNCGPSIFAPANGKAIMVDENSSALEGLINYAYGGTRGVSFNLPNIPKTSAGFVSCVVIEGKNPAKP